jgi:hypothetical protein
MFAFRKYEKKKRIFASMRGDKRATLVNVDNINLVNYEDKQTRLIFNGNTAVIDDPELTYFNFFGRLLVDDYEPFKPKEEKEVKDDSDTL